VLPSRGGSDPIVANIDGHPIYLSELGEASRTLPENLRSLPFDTLYPVLLDRMIDHEALVMMARQHGLENKPAVRQQIQAATERILEGAWLAVDAEPKVTEQAIRDHYNRLFANRPATEEVHARHILVTTKAEAETVLKELQNGADFATLASKVSNDPDAAKGGDLGFFRREQVWPSFADMAFSLQPGQIGPEPIHNEFGWHIVKVEERRLVAPPSYADVHDQIRTELMAEAVRQSVAKARAQVVIRKFNLDGSEMQEGPHLGSAPPQECLPTGPARIADHCNASDGCCRRCGVAGGAASNKAVRRLARNREVRAAGGRRAARLYSRPRRGSIFVAY
jgi:peptidyl-prolyl cis-trans isomerase C